MGFIEAVSLRANFRIGMSLGQRGIIGEMTIGRPILALRPGLVDNVWNAVKAVAYTMPISLSRLFEQPHVTDQIKWYGLYEGAMFGAFKATVGSAMDPGVHLTPQLGRWGVGGISPFNCGTARPVIITEDLGVQHNRWASCGINPFNCGVAGGVGGMNPFNCGVAGPEITTTDKDYDQLRWYGPAMLGENHGKGGLLDWISTWFR